MTLPSLLVVRRTTIAIDGGTVWIGATDQATTDPRAAVAAAIDVGSEPTENPTRVASASAAEARGYGADGDRRLTHRAKAKDK